jgi:hypothetical protein
MVACILSFCASSRIPANSARSAARARGQAGGATLSAANSGDGSRENTSTMDGMHINAAKALTRMHELTILCKKRTPCRILCKAEATQRGALKRASSSCSTGSPHDRRAFGRKQRGESQHKVTSMHRTRVLYSKRVNACLGLYGDNARRPHTTLRYSFSMIADFLADDEHVALFFPPLDHTLPVGEETGEVRNWSTTCASSRALVPSPRCPSWKI